MNPLSGIPKREVWGRSAPSLIVTGRRSQTPHIPDEVLGLAPGALAEYRFIDVDRALGWKPAS